MDVDAGDVDGFVGGQGAAVFHPAHNVLSPDLLHPDGHQAVVNENFLAGAHLLVKFGVGDGDHLPAALHLPGGKGEGVARLQGDGLGGEGLDADLRPLGVQNGGHGIAHGVPDGFEQIQPAQMLLMVAVGKIKAGRVHAVENEGADHLLVVDRGAQGADNFGFSHNQISSCGKLVIASLIPEISYRKTGDLNRCEIHEICTENENKSVKKCAPTRHGTLFYIN